MQELQTLGIDFPLLPVHSLSSRTIREHFICPLKQPWFRAMTPWGHLLPLGCFNSWNTTMSWGLLRFSARMEMSKPLSLLALKIASFSRSVQNTLSCRECTDSWPGLLKSCSSWIKLQQSQSQCTISSHLLFTLLLSAAFFYFGPGSKAQHSHKFTECCVILSSSETDVREQKFGKVQTSCVFSELLFLCKLG